MASPVSVALLTDLLTGSIDEDHEPLRRALAEVGVVGELVAWDDPAATPAAVAACHGLVVIRSPWDYPRHADRYLAALDALAAAVPVCNEPALVRWNIDKRYLADLAGAGIAVVATRFVGPDEDPVPVCRQAAQCVVINNNTVSCEYALADVGTSTAMPIWQPRETAVYLWRTCVEGSGPAAPTGVSPEDGIVDPKADEQLGGEVKKILKDLGYTH